MRNIDEILVAVYSALMADLPDIPYGKGTRRPDIRDVDVISSPQEWNSTALGFGGIGGASMETAQTVCVRHDRVWAVYFGGRHAYTVKSPSKIFFDDLNKRSMRDVNGSSIY